jgi:flagellar M-ring protein FliF
MATGIQTGLGRTGTGIAPPGKPANQNGMAKVMATWGSLSPKTRVFSIIGVVAVVVISLMTVVVFQASKPVQLYSFDLSPDDQKEIIAKLTTDNDQFEVVTNKIMVPPGQRQKLAAYLADYGLPHRPLVSSKQDSGMIPPSDKEKEQIHLQELEGQLIEQMRVMNFVADAFIQIVPADEEGALMGQAKPATAQVQLQLKPGMQPTREQITAITSMVAYSVRGLDVNNVKVIDDQGRILSRTVAANGTPGATADAGSNLGPDEEANLGAKTAYETHLKNNAMAALDQIFGVGGYALTVNADLDFSQKKIVAQTHGDTHVIDSDTKNETFANHPGSSASPDSKGSKEVGLSNFNTGAQGGTAATNYNRGETKQKFAIDVVNREEIKPPGDLKRLSASLVVDRAMTDEQIKQYQQMLSDSLGIMPERGDSVTVMQAAFSHPAVAAANPVSVFPMHHDYGEISPATIAVVGGGAVLLLLGLVSVFLIKQHNVQVDKSSLLLSTGGSSHTTEITDLLNEKSGKGQAGGSPTTTVNNRAELEKLAKEKPTRVAELLKSTWLSEKER